MSIDTQAIIKEYQNHESYDYKEYPTKIELLWGNTIVSHTINRKTLRKKDGTRCKVIKFNIRNKLDNEAQQLLNAVQKDNKI